MLRLLLIAILFLSCCASGGLGCPRSTGAEPRKNAAKSFAVKQTECSYPLISGPRNFLQEFLLSLPEGEHMQVQTVEHSIDGTQLRLCDWGADKFLILEVGTPPRFIDTPTSAHLNRAGKVVFTTSSVTVKDDPDEHHAYPLYTLHFPEGREVTVGRAGFAVDYDGRYICCAGKGDLTIRSVLFPEKVLVTCQMKGVPWRIYWFKGRVYVFVRGGRKDAFGNREFPEPLLCEIYRQECDRLVLERSLTIEAPESSLSEFTLGGDLWVLAWDISPDGKRLLLRKDVDGGRTRYYLYDPMTEHATQLERIDGDFIGFVDPALIQGAQKRPK